MAETLLAILLVCSSARGQNLVYRWPPNPRPSPRLARALPQVPPHFDNPWKASHDSTQVNDPVQLSDDETYEWIRPKAYRKRHRSSSASGRQSPSDEENTDAIVPNKDEYEYVLDYSADFLAGMLCPPKSMCHQKFELLVDDLAFLGHAVCSDPDGVWRFRPENFKPGSRGRESRHRHSSSKPESVSPEQESSAPPKASSGLQIFQMVFVLDLPDPSSSASGNITKYFDIIYEEISFPITAILFQEQVVSHFVEIECEKLNTLRDTSISRGELFSSYITHALDTSSIAASMKTLYEAIKYSSMAYLTVHNIPLEIQLPPNLDILLHVEDESEIDAVDDEEAEDWGSEFSLGWKLPLLTPWKSLLLLDKDGLDPLVNLKDPNLASDDRGLVEGLVRFLENVSVTISLNDMASLLDWDLKSQLFPAVRWLVWHRRAKVVDLVHHGLKTVFTLPPKFQQSLSSLTADFEKEFSHPVIPPLPELLATISSSSTKEGRNHFFAAVVQSKDLINLYHDVVRWMLVRDMLITLHLRVRIIATRDVKLRVRLAHEQKHKLQKTQLLLSLSPKSARQHSQRLPSADSRLSELVIEEDDNQEKGVNNLVDDEDDEDGDDSGWDTAADSLWPSIINDPGRAVPLQRRWLAAMSEGKDPHIVQRFERINQYFDGRRADDEILYRAEISRKELREVLHHYDSYLQTFLHPS